MSAFSKIQQGLMPSLALPLNVVPTPSKSGENDKEKTPAPSAKHTKPSAIVASDISSPHELTAFVEGLLAQLDTKFDEMSSQILDKMAQMSTRVDALEASIHDIINGDVTAPQSPSLIPATPGIRRNDSEQ